MVIKDLLSEGKQTEQPSTDIPKHLQKYTAKEIKAATEPFLEIGSTFPNAYWVCSGEIDGHRAHKKQQILFTVGELPKCPSEGCGDKMQLLGHGVPFWHCEKNRVKTQGTSTTTDERGCGYCSVESPFNTGKVKARNVICLGCGKKRFNPKNNPKK